MLAYLSYTPLVDIEIGPLAISPHGIGTGVGFAAGGALLLRTTRSRGIDDEVVLGMLSRAIVAALVGARVGYVINHPGSYSNPLDILRVWEGGASLLGGIAAAIAVCLPQMRRHRLDFWALMDAAAPGLALGIAIGRIGDLIVGDHLGKPTRFPLGYQCTGAHSASPCDAPIGQAVHQPALYDLVSVSLLLGVLLWLQRWGKLRIGSLILVFAGWYGTGRVAEDFFRIDETHGLFLTPSQWASLVVLVVAFALLLTGRRPRRHPEFVVPTTTTTR